MSGSQPAARFSGSAAPSQPHWAPSPLYPKVNPGEPTGLDSLAFSALQQEVFALRQAVSALAEINANDISHLAEAKVIEAERPNPWPWIAGAAIAGFSIYWLFFASTDSVEDEKTTMGSTRSSGGGISKVADKVVGKVIDRALGKALSAVF